MRSWFGGPILLVFVIKINQHVAVGAVRSQQNQNDEIGNEQCQVECVGVIEALKSLIQEMLADVLAHALGSKDFREQLGSEEHANEWEPLGGSQRVSPKPLFYLKRRAGKGLWSSTVRRLIEEVRPIQRVPLSGPEPGVANDPPQLFF